MSSDSESDIIPTPPESLNDSKITCTNLLPQKSRKKYESVYKAFMNWRSCKNENSFSENVLLSYFNELSEKYKSPSLWVQYSMLKTILNLNNNVSIEHYLRLRRFLKQNSEGYESKKAKTFTPDQIKKFIKEAPDLVYLATKVALIMGITGACRANELHSMKVEDVQDLTSVLLVTVPKTSTNIVRKFTISGYFYKKCKKYSNLRPRSIPSNSYFLHYNNGKCTPQNIGINKIGTMGKQIAKFLRLSDPEMYTGHTFRRSSATLLFDAGGDISLKRHLERHLESQNEWSNTSMAEGYVDVSIDSKIDATNEIFLAMNKSISTSLENTDATPVPKPNHERIKLEYYGMEDDDDDDDDFLPLSQSKKKEAKPSRHSQRKSTNNSDHPPPSKKPAAPTQASINARIDVDNEFELFGKSIAVQLKKMPLDRALICQEKLQQVMTQERLTQMQKGGSSANANVDMDPLAQF